MQSVHNREKNDIEDERKLRAAYALNLCMVSASQIIDYDDIYILEQEYDSILNNLNLEEMPKDEALLDILKQFLNVITFFRIQERDKVFLEREYQQRVKDAIWSAVPNLSVVVAGGNPVTMAVSLAAQVGIGYMNYRREKSKIQLEEEKERWRLQRSAMEQFNGLRRELFDTAWRLADHYGFPDAYRITERQIARYNKILMDNDPLRRYERLGGIAEHFEAYPPFFYFWGNAANMVYQDERYDAETRAQYRGLACEHFKKFLDRTEHNLLREDHLLASCALEYFDLLALPAGSSHATDDRAYLESLLDRAVAASGSAFDVLQLCATAHLKIGNMGRAAALMRMLVNEEYNTSVNAQLLSAIYVAQYVQRGDEQARRDYQTLCTRVSQDILFPLPAIPDVAEKNRLQAGFVVAQQKLLARRYSMIVTNLVERYTVRFNQVFPAADGDREYPDQYFDNAGEVRKQDILDLFENPHTRQEYILRLSGAHVEARIIGVLNDVYAEVCGLPCMEDRVNRQQFYAQVCQQTEAQQGRFDILLSKIYGAGGEDEFSKDDCRQLLSFSLLSFTGRAFDALYGMIVASIKGLTSMAAISQVESRLEDFCTERKLPYPVICLSPVSALARRENSAPLPFDERLLGRRAFQLRQDLDQAERMAKCVLSYQAVLLPGDKNPFKLYVRGDSGFISYIEKDRALREFGQDRIVAIIDDSGLGDKDIILTTDGVCPYFRTLFMKTLVDPVAYESVKFIRRPVPTLKIGEFDFMEKKVELEVLFKLFNDLADIERAHDRAMNKLPGHGEG